MAHGWPFYPLELVDYKTIYDCAINVVWSSSHGWPCGLDARHLYGQACRFNTRPLHGRTYNFSSCQLPLNSFIDLLDDCRNIDGLHLF